MFDIILILGGFALMIAGAYALVGGASNIARQFGIKEMVIGATIVALGTSLPEFVTVVIASIKGADSIGLGNIVGSNIINVIGILGVAVIIMPVAVKGDEISKTTIIAFILASLYLLVCMLSKSRIGRIDGLILVTGFVLYTWFSYAHGKVATDAPDEIPAATAPAETPVKDSKENKAEKGKP